MVYIYIYILFFYDLMWFLDSSAGVGYIQLLHTRFCFQTYVTLLYYGVYINI